MHGGAPLPILCLLFTTVPHQGQNTDWRGQFPGSVVAIRALIWSLRLNAPLGHEGAPLPTLCLLYITVPRNGQKGAHLGTKILKKNCNFPQQRRGMFYFKNDSQFLLRKKGTMWVWEFWGSKRPLAPLIPPPLTVPLQGQPVAIRALKWKAKCPIKA